MSDMSDIDDIRAALGELSGVCPDNDVLMDLAEKAEAALDRLEKAFDCEACDEEGRSAGGVVRDLEYHTCYQVGRAFKKGFDEAREQIASRIERGSEAMTAITGDRIALYRLFLNAAASLVREMKPEHEHE